MAPGASAISKPARSPAAATRRAFDFVPGAQSVEKGSAAAAGDARPATASAIHCARRDDPAEPERPPRIMHKQERRLFSVAFTIWRPSFFRPDCVNIPLYTHRRGFD